MHLSNYFHDKIDKCLWTTDVENTDEEMKESLANTDADLEEDSSEPKGKVSVSKSKVNWIYTFTYMEILNSFYHYRSLLLEVLIPPIQKLQLLTDVSLQMKKLALLDIQLTEILLLVLRNMTT